MPRTRLKKITGILSIKFKVTYFIFVPILLFYPMVTFSNDETCLECHGDQDFVIEHWNKQISLYVDGKTFSRSVHGDFGCVSCHEDADVEEFPHDENLADVKCSECHDNVIPQFKKSVHFKLSQESKPNAPTCYGCHGKHDILSSTNQESRTHVMNISSTCGSCHVETKPLTSQNNIIQGGYKEIIHGKTLLQKGLKVTAVCTSCHSDHDILPGNNPRSPINYRNIKDTCMKCHARIENIHSKIIEPKSWHKKPLEIPTCIDCHSPHNIRKLFYEKDFSDKKCLSCHSDVNLTRTVNGKKLSLYVDEKQFRQSVHGKNPCIKCHTKVSTTKTPVCLESGKVDCSMCHAEQVSDYKVSQHGAYHSQGNPNAPYCTDCHGKHDMQSKTTFTSPIFPANIHELCARCHREGQKAAVVYSGKEHEIIKNYTMSIHGKGLLKSGLMVTATCVDCHSSHKELPVTNPESTVHPANIATTCAKCHLGIYEIFKTSVHSPLVTKTSKSLPVCKDCHLSHTIKRVDLDDFRQEILNQCGKCHKDVQETYFDTFHGKVSKLGSAKTAKCYDCHGSHNILPPSHPGSTLSKNNVVCTCKKCHPGSNEYFVGYLTHATHHNKEKYPYLFYTFWVMTGLLIGTFTFFGAHTILWLTRTLRDRLYKGKKQYPPGKQYYQRFDSFSRFLHLLVIVSFLSLAITGMTIKFSGAHVFQVLSRLMGGYAVTGFIHRVAAVITFLYFILHLGYLVRKKRIRKIPLKQLLTGENTLMFRLKDLSEFVQTIKWFLGKAPRPKYGRWTYWEKFDYFAVFWGVTVIGISGLLLWFSEFFTRALGVPGWIINVATIIHSDEALLATGFIFTIHFFNTHFRPEVFPMDPVIFTGGMTLDQLKEERPREYQEMIRSRKLKNLLVEKPPQWFVKGATIFGLTCLFIGICIIVLILYSMLFLFK